MGGKHYLENGQKPLVKQMVGGRIEQKTLEHHMGHVGSLEWNSAQPCDRICQIYNSRTQALPQDVIHLLWKLKEQIIQLSLATTKQQWINSVEMDLQDKPHNEYGQYFSKQRFMTLWVIH